MKKLLLAALAALLPAVALADTTITGPITFSTGLHVVGSKVTIDTPTLTTLGGIKSHAAVTHQFLTGLSTAGALSGAQPACADLSDSGSGCAGTLPAAANPTATIGTAAVNGSAGTFMRSDAAPAIPQASSSVFGAVKVDGTTITASGGVISAAGGGGGSPASPVNSLQKNAAGNFGAAAVSDDGATLTATEPTLINIPGTLGSELLSNPGFVANDTGWTLGSGDTVWSSGLFTTTCSCSDPSVSINLATVAGHYYKVHVDFTITGDQDWIHFTNNRASSNGSSGPNEDFVFQANYTGTDTILFDFFNYNPGAVRLMTGASVKEVSLPGGPLTVQAPDGNQPVQVDALGNVIVSVNPNAAGAANLKLFGMPNADPSIGAAVWENRGVLMLSGFATPWLSSGDIPNANLLGGTGSAFTSVSVGSGLNLGAGVLTATGPAFTDPGTYPAFAFWSGANAINGGWSITAPSNKGLDFITVNDNAIHVTANGGLFLASEDAYITFQGNNSTSGILGQAGKIAFNAGYTLFDVGADVQMIAGDGHVSGKQGGDALLRAGAANGAGDAAGGTVRLQGGLGHGNGTGGDVHLTTGLSGGGTGRAGVVWFDGVEPPSSCTGITGGGISQQTVGGVGNVLVLCP